MSESPAPVGVFLVDDNLSVAEAMERWLRPNASIRWLGAATNAGEALVQIAASRPRVVLLDIGLDRHDPFDLLKRVVKERPDSRVVMFTGYVSGELVERSLQAGASGYVLKDHDPADLLRLILDAAAGNVVMCDTARRALGRDRHA